jgi:hypothetical protein
MNAGNKGKKALIGLAACAALLGARKARAEIVLYDKDTWTLKTDGLAQGFYMLSMGDTDPVGTTAIDHDFDFLGTAPGNPDGKFVSSRFRSGWTGGRFNWRATKQMTPDTKASAYLGIAYSISTHNAPAAPGGPWDIRNGFVEVEGPWGTVQVGRAVGLYTLGSIIHTIMTTSAANGLGNTCGVGGDNLSCYTSGYGVKFPGFWAGFYYQTPDLSGLKIKVGAMDPVQVGEEGPGGTPVPYSSLWPKTPLPHFQTLVTYNLDAGAVKAMVHFNGFWQRIGRNFGTPLVSQWRDPIGGGAGLNLTIDIFKIGGGGSFEHGTNLYVPLVGSETVDGNGTLRDGTSFYGDAMVTLGPVDIAAGYGQANLKRTAYDEANSPNINKMQSNIRGSIQYHVAPLTFVAGLNLLHHEWYAGNKQNVQVFSLGANFAY